MIQAAVITNAAGTDISADVAAVKAETASILTDTGTTLPGTLTTIEGKIDTVDSIVDAILVDTNELQTDLTDGGRLDLLIDSIITDIAALNDVSTADINAQVLDVLNVDTFAEPSGVPAATASLADKIGFLATLARNKITSTASGKALRNDADSGDIATQTHSDDGTTYTKGEWT